MLLQSWKELAKARSRTRPWLAQGVFDAQQRDGLEIDKKWRHGKLENALIAKQQTAAAAGRVCAQAKVQLHFLPDDLKKLVAERPGALKIFEEKAATTLMNSAVVKTLSAGLEMAAQSHAVALNDRRDIGTLKMGHKEQKLLKSTPA